MSILCKCFERLVRTPIRQELASTVAQVQPFCRYVALPESSDTFMAYNVSRYCRYTSRRTSWERGGERVGEGVKLEL